MQPVRIAQRQHGAEKEQADQGLLEGALGEVRSSQERHTGQRRRRQAQEPARALEGGQGGQRCEHRDGDQEAGEAGRRPGPEAGVERGYDGMRPVRVARDGDVRVGPERAERVRLRHVHGQVAVDPRAQLSDPVVGGEGQRAADQNGEGDRSPPAVSAVSGTPRRASRERRRRWPRRARRPPLCRGQAGAPPPERAAGPRPVRPAPRPRTIPDRQQSAPPTAIDIAQTASALR